MKVGERERGRKGGWGGGQVRASSNYQRNALSGGGQCCQRRSGTTAANVPTSPPSLPPRPYYHAPPHAHRCPAAPVTPPRKWLGLGARSDLISTLQHLRKQRWFLAALPTCFLIIFYSFQRASLCLFRAKTFLHLHHGTFSLSERFFIPRAINIINTTA